MIMAGKSITYLGTAFKPQSGELSLKLLENFFGEIFFEKYDKIEDFIVKLFRM